MVFLDTAPVIYFVEAHPDWGPKAAARLTALQAAGEVLAVSDLVRMECLVKPLKAGDTALVADFGTFFTSPGVSVLPVTAAVCDRAALIRAAHNFKPLDSLHLAAAVVHGCTRFLTNDTRLGRFPDIPVDVLT
ncbi:MAG TPA: type II toxin-antitoxin system VapC family toxin [Gemmataceae bacterium]|nr:type II toxin-antitoxin system VapC family toxin [Gemmataceae bacterium]